MSPSIILKIAGGYLRILKVSDVHPGYVDGLNDPEVNRYLEIRHTQQNIQTVTEFIEDNRLRNDTVFFGIWQDHMLHHCGTVRLHGIDRVRGSAHIGVCLFDRSAWGKKLGLKAVSIVTQWAFDLLNLNQIEAGVYVNNIASQKTFLAAGYKWVGRNKDKFFFEGNPTVVNIYLARRVVC